MLEQHQAPSAGANPFEAEAERIVVHRNLVAPLEPSCQRSITRCA